MGKQNPYAKMLDGMKREIDDNAFTAKEIAEQLGFSLSHTMKVCRERVESGQWEKVWRRGSQGFVSAYRPKK